METRAQALRKPVIPAKAGIHFKHENPWIRFRWNGSRKCLYFKGVLEIPDSPFHHSLPRFFRDRMRTVRIAEYPLGLRDGSDSRRGGVPERHAGTLPAGCRTGIPNPPQRRRTDSRIRVQPAIGTVRPVASTIGPKRQSRGWWHESSSVHGTFRNVPFHICVNVTVPFRKFLINCPVVILAISYPGR